MLISYEHKFIFVHVYNTAGASIKEALKDYASELEKFKINRPSKEINDRPNPLYDKWYTYLYHVKAKEIKKELPKEVYDNFYKFAFVRNPWDRMVSAYHSILSNTRHPYHRSFKSLRNFDEFVECLVTIKKNEEIQKNFVIDSEGKLIVDFVGRYENLEQDFYRLCTVLNVKAFIPPSKNPIKRKYRDYYNDKTIKLIEDYLKEDIEFFGYTFDNS